MSSLWTPGGEVPIERNRPAAEPPAEEPRGDQAGPVDPEATGDDAAMAAELQRFLLESPAEQVVAQHAMGLYELAVLHLSQPEPRLPDARLAIDALAALLEGTGDRLGEAGHQLRQVLPQLQMAFVQVADRGGAEGGVAG